MYVTFSHLRCHLKRKRTQFYVPREWFFSNEQVKI